MFARDPVELESQREAEMSDAVGDRAGQCPAVPCQHQNCHLSVCLYVCACVSPESGGWAGKGGSPREMQ